MLRRATWLHLRLPFSILLMPVFCFAVSQVENPHAGGILLAFFILHFLVYPASNAYNSYYDKDEDSIGGLEKPPPVSRELLYTSLVLDALAILLALFVSFYFALGILIYGLVSKAYSYDKIRLKKYPLLSWLTIGIFQGAFTFVISYHAASNAELSSLRQPSVWMAAGLSTWMLLGSYPMTQVYQHQEDARRGDLTLSRMLGIRGTFLFTLLVFGSVGIAFFFYFWKQEGLVWAIAFELCLMPVVAYFLYWLWQVWQDPSAANFKATMRLNWISAFCMNLFFISLGVMTHF